MEIKIRNMKSEDVMAVASMNQLLTNQEKSASKKDADFFETFATGPQKLAFVWVATDENKPIGFIAARDWASFGSKTKVRQIDLLYVAEDYRGMGIANDLIAHVIVDAFENECGRIDIQTEASNEDSNALYKKLGFKEKKETRNFYQLLPKEFDA